MKTIHVQTEPDSRVTISRTGGDLTVKGWREDRVRIQSTSEFEQVENEDGLQVQFSGDGVVLIPHASLLKINSVGGDAHLKGLQSSVTLDKIGGDLFLSDLGKIEVNHVGGSTFAKNVRGDVSIRKCGGDCTVQDADGQLNAEKVGGDLIFNSIGGSISAKAGGDIHGSFSPVSWQAYNLESGSDLYLQLPADLNAEIHCRSKAEHITFFEDELEVVTSKESVRTFGEGGVSIQLQAGGEITVSARSERWAPTFNLDLELDPDFSTIADEITTETLAQLEKQLSSLDQQLQASLSGLTESLSSLGLREEELQSLQEKLITSQENATRKVEKTLQKTQAKIEKKIAKAQSKAGRARGKKSSFDLESFLGESSREVELEAERMLILNMLQEKKITADQANDLLSALEGGD